VAAYLKRRIETEPEEKLVVVVSAQKLATSVLERSARRIVRSPSARALDLLWSTGELRSVAILTLHLEAIRVLAVGLNVHETGLQFSAEAQLCPPRLALRGAYIDRALAGHAVVVVPGFLATRSDEAIVTLGRGGSDLSAVLLAVGLGASRCELLKDVPGYFEEDPRATARIGGRGRCRTSARGAEFGRRRDVERDLAQNEADVTRAGPRTGHGGYVNRR